MTELAKSHGAIQWWAPSDLACTQAEILITVHQGRCDRHAILIAELAAWRIREEALARVLPVIPAPPREG